MKQWLLALLIDGRADVTPLYVEQGLNQEPIFLAIDGAKAAENKETWSQVNNILRIIMANNEVRLVWLGRRNPSGLGIQWPNNILCPSLDSLSSGEAILLGMFGTLIRYGDEISDKRAVDLSDMTGICLIDEVDAHMHIDLQYRALPNLIKLFPRIQFILSTHSPLFVLGMEQKYGASGIAIIELPNGTQISGENYSEFGHALSVMQATKVFSVAVSGAAAKPGKMLVLVEGETDPIYYKKAAELLDYQSLMDSIEIDWVGAKDPKGGQGYNTGAAALRASYNVLSANPNLLARTVLLIFDNDTGALASDSDKLYVRRLVGESRNERVTAGIESLLPAEVFVPEVFERKISNKPNGTESVVTTVNKMKLCQYICNDRQLRSDFVGFAPLLDMIKETLQSEMANSVQSD